MKIKYKITVPKPCHEDWNQMTPDETGRFCSSCIKSVVDFTNMKAPEIQEYFIKNQGQSVCGRFKNEQINKFDIQIPQSILYKKMPFHKAFILALFIAMGSSLFSCKNNDASLGEVTVVQDTIKHDKKDNIDDKREVLGKIDTRTYDSLVKAGVEMPPPPNVQQVKFVKPSKSVSNIKGKAKIIKTIYPEITGDVDLAPHKPNPGAGTKDEIFPAGAVQIQPTYPGGLTKFYDYFNSNFKVSEENKDIPGRLIFSCIINADGSLTDIKILRGINKEIDSESIRVLKASPKWIPGEQNGKKVKVSYALPIKITAQ